MKTLALILAAGQGKRMHSAQPKVLQPVGGKAMIVHLLETLQALAPTRSAVIYGHQGEQLRACIAPAWPQLRWIAQTEQRGTGHAVRMALDEIAQAELVLILYGDTPLVRAETLQRLLDAARHNGFALLTAVADNPFGYGRIVRDAAGEMTAIVEEKDASDAERAIREINTGMMAVKSEYLARYLPQLQDDNAAGEFYLTDVIALHVAAGWRVVTVPATDTAETLGINTRRRKRCGGSGRRRRCWQRALP